MSNLVLCLFYLQQIPIEEARKQLQMGGHITIRQVTSMDRKLEVRERMKRRYAFKDYPDEFNFRCKCIVVFQNLDGVDVVLFGLYVYEHDERNPEPNKRTVYVSYLDSVYYMRPRQMRTFIYHEILISYLDYVRKRGFSSAHIWACPPLKGDDYILYAKPEDQKTPRDDRLRQWYIDMLVECQKRGVVGKVTNMYDLYFSNPRNDATVVPYMDGDYFPAEVENIIKDIEEGKGGKKGGSQGKKKKNQNNKSKQKKKSGRGGTRSTGLDEDALRASGFFPPGMEDKSIEEGGRDYVMVKLGETIQPMKESFIVAFLAWEGAKPENMVVPKEIQDYREKHGIRCLSGRAKETEPAGEDREDKKEESADEIGNRAENERPATTNPSDKDERGNNTSNEESTNTAGKENPDNTEGKADSNDQGESNDKDKDVCIKSEGNRQHDDGENKMEVEEDDKKNNDNDIHDSKNGPNTKLDGVEDITAEKKDTSEGQKEYTSETKAGESVQDSCETVKAGAETEKLEEGPEESKLGKPSSNAETDADKETQSQEKDTQKGKAEEDANKLSEEIEGVDDGNTEEKKDSSPHSPAPTSSAEPKKDADGDTNMSEVASPAETTSAPVPNTQAQSADAMTIRKGKFAAMAAKKRDLDGNGKEPEEAKEAGKKEKEKEKKPNRGFTVKDSKGRTVKVIDDDDEEMDCEFLNNRQAFLNLCQGNHYQFDQLRRAKHSSMMVLWHLHNRDAPKFVQQCATCSREILAGYRFHCAICADFDQCQECVSNPKVARHPHQLKPIPVASSQQPELTEEQRKERQRSIQLHMTLLLHAATCTSAKCPSANCTKMKGLLKHGAQCQVKATGGCNVCKRIWALLQIHARQCKTSTCPVPNCMAIRERVRQLKKQQQAMDDRRRQEMNRAYHR